MKSNLVGYLRKAKIDDVATLKISISVECLEKVVKYMGKFNKDYINLYVNAEKAQEVIESVREVTSVVELTGE